MGAALSTVERAFAGLRQGSSGLARVRGPVLRDAVSPASALAGRFGFSF